MHHLLAVVHGRVQGVGFRWFVSRRAGEHGVAGTVRNLPGGGVEVRAEGPRAALEALLDDLRSGPPRSRVERVDELWSEGPPRHAGFGIMG
jgi:acylphosphatase